MEAKSLVVVTLGRDQAQELLNLIDDLHELFQKGEVPDIGLLLQLADTIDHALNLEKEA